MRAENINWGLKCHNIHKSFPDGRRRNDVLNGACFQAAPGEATFILGPSGCGKSTLLSIIAGLLTPDLGNVDILGTVLTELTDRDRIQFRSSNIGIVLQEFYLLPALNVVENVALPLQVLGWPARKASREAYAALERVSLMGHEHKYPSELSVGQKQRTAVARAIVHRPGLILCDEPTAALDAETGSRVMDVIRTCSSEDGTTVIVVTHDLRITRSYDRTWEIRGGELQKHEIPQATRTIQ